MSKETGGPAFPTNSTHHDGYYGGLGITLRDYFAAKAMQGLVGASQIFPRAAIAEHAYLMADAMIAERDKNE
jgi:hypothetical protein